MRNDNENKDYFPALDGIRGVAALLIAIRHTPELFGTWAFQESYLAVDLFFVLSGVVICSNYEKRLLNGLSSVQFSLIRLIRIYPFYILGALAGFILTVSTATASDLFKSDFYLLLAILMIPNIGFGFPSPLLSLFPLNGPSWSLFFELFANVFYGRFIGFFLDRRLTILLVVSAIGLFLCVYIAPHHTLNIGFTSKSWPGGFFRVIYSFYMGVFIYRHYKNQKFSSISNFRNDILILTVLSIVGVILSVSPHQREQSIYDLIIVLIVFPFFVNYALRISPSLLTTKIMKFSGEVSYPLYALHEPVGALLYNFLTNRLGVSISKTSPIAGIIFLIVFVPVCWILSKIYDRPIRTIVTGWFHLSKNFKKSNSI